jgi:RNA polymerase sigma-70 factor (ECF subfamily)
LSYGVKETVMDDDQGWVERSRQGDHEAFETLVRRYQRMIYALAYRMTGSTADAEDLTQETFIRAHEQLASYRAEAKFSSWLYRIAVNHSLNWRKRAERREKVHNEWQARRDQDSSPDGALARKVQDALMKLNPKQRAAIVLTIYDGLSHAEAARALGCSETTVSWRLFAARAKLKRLLKDAKADPGHE